VVALTCNPTYLAGRDPEENCLKSTQPMARHGGACCHPSHMGHINGRLKSRPQDLQQEAVSKTTDTESGPGSSGKATA
jgi:hypothetical protein